MKSTRSVALSGSFLLLFACVISACGGSQGPAGQPGAAGQNGATGATGVAGATGPTGSGGTSKGEASISAVEPLSAFLGATLDVLISGDVTQWSSATTVTFGTGITVNSVVVGSPTALLANITVATDTTPGAKTITVTDTTGTETLAGVFTVGAPVSVTVSGTLAQGSIVNIQVTNLDPTTPFDATSGTTASGATVFTNLTIPATSGVIGQPDVLDATAVTALSANMLLFIDVDATPGPVSLTLESGPAMSPTDVAIPMPPLTIAARSAIQLTSGTTVAGTEATPYASSLYSLSVGSNLSVEYFDVSTTSDTGTPFIALLPLSGHFADALAIQADSATTYSAAAGEYYAIIEDLTGTASLPFSLTASATAATAVEWAAGDDTYTSATPLTGLPAVVSSAALASSSDINWYSFTATAADVGKAVDIQIYNTTMEVDVDCDESDGQTSISPYGGPYPTYSLLTDPIVAAGTYYVQVSVDFSSNVTSGSYVLSVSLVTGS